MRRTAKLLLIPILVVTLMACEFAGITLDLGGGDGGGGGGGSAAAPVEAGIDAPANGANLQMAPIEVAYHASSTDNVATVELSINGEVMNTFTSPASEQKVVALNYKWTPTVSGSHTIRVRAQSSNGAWSDYAAITINVQGEQPPEQPSVQPPAQPPSEPPQEPEVPQEPTPSATPKDMTIYDVKHDKDKFYYGGGGCVREVTISAKVTKPEDVKVMVLFIRFFDLEGAGTTKWDAGRAMSKKSEGSYSITLFSEKIPNYNAYEFATMNYQIVAQDKSGNTNATRTEVFKDIDLEICQ